MRGCLTVLVLAAALSAAAWSLLAQPVAERLVHASLAASGFRGDDVEVRIDATPLDLLRGRAEAVRVRALDARLGNLAAVQLDATLLDVGLLDGSAAGITGRLDGVEVTAADGSLLPVASIELDGPIEAAAARLLITPDVLEALAARLLGAEFGTPPATVRLAPPAEIVFEVGNLEARGHLSVGAAGDLLLGVSVPGSPTIRFLSPDALAPLRLMRLAVGETGLILFGEVDASALLP